MKKYTLLSIFILLTTLISAQSVAFHENFESPSFADSVSSTQTIPGNDDWVVTNTLSYTGQYSDSCSVILAATSYLTTDTFTTLGKYVVYLDFEQICKVDFLDFATVEVSIDNGVNWIQLTFNEYLGAALNFATLPNRFNSSSYGNDWQPGTGAAIPDNSWWKHERFDLSALASDKAAVIVRFKLVDSGVPGANGNYGWLIDDIVVRAAISELDPPVITILPPVLQTTVYFLGPYNIKAEITDASGIDTALLVYNVNAGLNDTVGMFNVNADTFTAQIPAVNDQDVVCYHVVAWDVSVAHNMAKEPTNSCIVFTASSGITFPFLDNFDIVDIWTPTSNSPTSNWELGTPNYGATNTAYTVPNSWDINLTTAYGSNADATLTSPVFDFSAAVSATLSVWMNYNTEGGWDGVRIEYTTNGTTWDNLGVANDPLGVNWYNNANLNSSSEPGWAGNSNGWIEAQYDLSFLNYVIGGVQFRFIFTSDGTGQIDGFSIDNFAIMVPAPQDVAVNGIVTPADGCGLGNETVSIDIYNAGLDTINGNLTASYFVYGVTSPVTEVITTVIPPAVTYTYTFAATADLSVTTTDVTYDIIAYANLLNDPNPYNDTTKKSILSGHVPVDPIVNNVNIPYGTNTTLNATSTYPISWWDVPVGGTAIGTGPTYVTPILYGTTIYFVDVESTTGTGCTSNRVPDTVFVGNVPPIDASAVDFLAPISDFNLTASEAVTVKFKNYGTLPISNFSVYYSINGGAPVINTIYTVLLNLDTVIHTFSVNADLSAFGVYQFKAWVSVPGDLNHINDTIIVDVENMIFKYCDSYSTSGAAYEDIGNVTISNLNNGNPLPVSNNPTATQAYTDFTYLPPVQLAPGVNYPISISQISASGQYACDVNVYIDYNRNGAWDLPEENIFHGNTTNTLTTVTGNVVVPYTAVPGITMMRVVLDETGTAPPCGTYLWGETEDYLAMIVPPIPQDAGVIEIITPTAVVPEASSVPVRVVIKNFGTDTIFNLDIEWKLNGGAAVSWPWSGSLSPTDTTIIVLPDVIIPPLDNTICAYTILAGDINDFNDQTCKDFYGDPLQDAYAVEILTPVTACGMGIENVTLRIVNDGLNEIKGNVIANYSANGGPAVSETVPNNIAPGVTLDYVFNTTIDMSTTLYDSIFDFVAWVDLPNDPIDNNDTTSLSVLSAHIPPPPVVSNVTIPYGNVANLTANSLDSLFWFDVPAGGVEIQKGPNYTTPVLYATTIYYVEARSGIGDIKITEITQYKTGTGQTPNYPPDVTADWDGIELANLGSAPMDLSGYTVHVEGGTIIDYTIPNGIMLNPGEVLLFTIYGAGAVNNPANNFYVISTTNSVGSTTLVGYHIKDPAGLVLDAVATNGYQFNPGSGVTPADWSGNLPFSSAGVIRTISDNNLASDWIISSATNTQTIGAMNPGLGSSGGNGCASIRVPDTVFVGGVPPYDVCVAEILDPVSDFNLSGSEVVRVEIRNYGTLPISNFPVSYTYNGSPLVTDTIKLTMQPGDTITHQFSANANLAAYSIYNFKAYAYVPGDNTPLNDTAYASVENRMLIYCPSYSTSPTSYEDIGNVTISNLNNGNPLPVSNNPTAVNGYSDFTNLPPVQLAPGVTYPISVSQISASGQYSCDVKVYIDYNRNGQFDVPAENAFSAQTSASVTTVSGNITVPFWSNPGITIMRVVLDETTTAPPCGTYLWGETEDYLVMLAPLIPHDAGVVSILQPGKLDDAGNNVPVEVVIQNFGTDPITNMDIVYEVNGGPPVVFNYANTLAPAATDNVSLQDHTLFMGDNFLCAYTVLAGDSNTFNDGKCTNTYGQFTTPPPFTDSFDGPVNLWWNDSVPNAWERGIPDGTVINYAHSSPNVWATDLDEAYESNQISFLYSPKFTVLSAIGVDSLKFWHFVHTQPGDGGNIQYLSTTGWRILGMENDPNAINWYNSPTNMWTINGIGPGWKYAAYDLKSINDFAAVTQFRFVFYGNNSGNTTHDGWAIDDFKIIIPRIPEDGGVISIIEPTSPITKGTQFGVKVKIQNFGTDTLYSIPIYYHINNGIPVNNTWNGTLLPDSVTEHTFPTIPSPWNDFSLCAFTALSFDTYLFNDGYCENIDVIPPQMDAGIQSIVYPTFQTLFGYDTTISVWLKNYGSDVIDSCDLAYTIAGTVQSSETWTGNLAPGDSIQYTFINKYSHTFVGYYYLKAYTSLISDGFSPNDTVKLILESFYNDITESELEGFSLSQNIPNPATGFTHIEYSIPRSGEVRFVLMNYLGQMLYTKRENNSQGIHQLEVNVNEMPSGIYFYFIEFEDQRLVKKMVISN